MKKLILLCLFMSAHLFANEELSPQQAVANYFEFFNNEDRASLNASSGNPFVFIIGGKPTAYSKYGDAVDFDGMKASGWSYSRVHKNELIYQDDISAMVDINFSRYDDADMPISTTDVVYLLVMRNGSWKVKGGFVNGNLTLGRD
ncbi:MAG: hypothetical protein P8L39_07930 [Halioglobus sp.]|nr:hypothetical protein [Halioglobus sp.]